MRALLMVMAKLALVALGILPDGTKAAAHLRRPLRPRRRFASGEHAPATALAASQPLHECGDRRVRHDGEGDSAAPVNTPTFRQLRHSTVTVGSPRNARSDIPEKIGRLLPLFEPTPNG